MVINTNLRGELHEEIKRELNTPSTPKTTTTNQTENKQIKTKTKQTKTKQQQNGKKERKKKINTEICYTLYILLIIYTNLCRKLHEELTNKQKNTNQYREICYT